MDGRANAGAVVAAMHATRDAQTSQWVDSPRVQSVLPRLPLLECFDLAIGPTTKLLPGVVASAAKWTTAEVQVPGELPPDCSLRALRLAPALTNLHVDFGAGLDAATAVAADRSLREHGTSALFCGR